MNPDIETVLAALGLKSMKGGVVMSIGGWLLSSAAAAWFGALVAAIGLGMNAYFGWKRDRREQKEHDARMRALEH